MKVEVKHKRVFLSGPMSDDPETYHASDFIEAHVKLKKLGALYVFNPVIEWLQEKGETKSHEYYMQVCLSQLVRKDAYENMVYGVLVQLPDWDLSEGATTEYEVAKACGIPVCGIDDVC